MIISHVTNRTFFRIKAQLKSINMKSFICALAILAIPAVSIAQDVNTIYLDEELSVCKKRKASYRKEVLPNSDGYQVKVFNMNEKLFMEGNSKDQKGEKLEGTTTYYYPNGQVESVGQNQNGTRVGVWNRFDKEGKPASERVYYHFDPIELAYTYVDEMPQFDNGNADFNDFLKHTLKDCVQTTDQFGQPLEFSFVINENGNPENQLIIEGINASIDEKLFKILEAMPTWQPGTKHGEPTRVLLKKTLYCKVQ